MCIAIISTAHPAYQLIIINNRDEYLHRPTAPAAWWQEPNTQVLGSRDLARPEQGTWMGVTRQGRVAVLTNYREPASVSSVSRGVIVNEYLTETAAASSSKQRSTRQFVADMIESQTAKKAGGFSLVCGRIGEPLAIISNRMPDSIDAVTWIAGRRGETLALSNTVFGDRSWPKIIDGERLTKDAIDAHISANTTTTEKKEAEEDLIARLFAVLSTDSLPHLNHCEYIREQHVNQLKESIFIPLLGNRAKYEAEAERLATSGLEGYMSGLYGTQKQTILLVDHGGRVRYVERSLYDERVRPIPIGEGDRSVEFVIE